MSPASVAQQEVPVQALVAQQEEPAQAWRSRKCLHKYGSAGSACTSVVGGTCPSRQSTVI